MRGTVPALELLERTRSTLPTELPVLLAGDIADEGDVQTALEAGADAAVLGTRFLLSEESRAHPRYKQTALVAEETVLTELFGLGWPAAPHRVLPNAATRRWLPDDGRGPAWALAAQRTLTPIAGRLPERLARRSAAAQRPALPLDKRPSI